MNIRLNALFEQVNTSKLNNWDRGMSQDTFIIKVVEVKGETVVVSVNGYCLEVTSRVPLVPGQVFLVRRAQKEGETETWHLIREVTESTPQSVLARFGLPEVPENTSILNALSKAGLPITEENLHLIQRLMEKSGGFTPANLMVAITSLKLGISFELLLQLLTPFVEKITVATDSLRKVNGGSMADSCEKLVALKGEDNRLAILGFRLKEALDMLQRMLRRLADKSGSAPLEELQRLSSGEGDESRLLLGGQLFACGQWNVEEQKPFYYIPLFALFRGEDHPDGEILIYPELSRGATCTRFLLNLATCYLGWIQVELTLQDSLLKVGMLVEEQTAKLLIDKYWPQLAEVLKDLRYSLIWSGCKVGRVKSFFRDLQKGWLDHKVHKALDLTV